MIAEHSSVARDLPAAWLWGACGSRGQEEQGEASGGRKRRRCPKIPTSESQLEDKLESRAWAAGTLGKPGLSAPSWRGGWTALDTSPIMSCSQLSSEQWWSLTQLPGRAEPESPSAHPMLCTPQEQSAAHPTSPMLPALGEPQAVGNQQEPGAMQPSAEVLWGGPGASELLPVSSMEKTLESTYLLTGSCSAGPALLRK